MKIIFKTLFGSHLYGTQTENSDKDYKAVYMADIQDILLKKDKDTIQENTKTGNHFGVRNTKDDIDCEYIELRKFLRDAMNGQTYALDMLFAPPMFWIEYDDVWEGIRENMGKLLSKNVKPFIGYMEGIFKSHFKELK
ncbi:MAG: nucleotidyltransferase domain-containing protein [Flavobacteriales bacterium]|nr:nucleotidyltransferase domain-containing protein [Flavobacteriales bacterium]